MLHFVPFARCVVGSLASKREVQMRIELWNGIFAPAATPTDIVNKLNTALKTVLQDPSFRNKLIEQGSIPVGNSSEEFKKIMSSEIEKWGILIKMAGATAN